MKCLSNLALKSCLLACVAFSALHGDSLPAQSARQHTCSGVSSNLADTARSG